MIISPGNNTDRRKKNPLHRRRLDRPRLTLLKVSCFVGHLGAIFFHRKLIKYCFQSVLPPLTQENHSTNQMCQVIAEQTQSFFHNYRLACDCCTAMIEDRNTENTPGILKNSVHVMRWKSHTCRQLHKKMILPLLAKQHFTE